MKKILYLIFIILLIIFGYIYYTYEYLTYYEEILNDVESIEVSLNNYSIFGTHLNIDGCIDKKLNEPKLVLKNKRSKIILDTEFYEEDNKICFYINKHYNEGIYLDGIKEGDYLLLINDDDKCYSIKNNTSYKDLEYYTITKNNTNNKININFKNYNNINYVRFIVKESSLPDDVYDIMIDPGHGGKDVGAIGRIGDKRYYEANLTLDVSLRIKKDLEKKGYKVYITRDSDIGLDIYGEYGRAVVANKYNTKYSFSIHFNSDYGVMKYGGVEIYTPTNIDLTLATLFADNLSKIVGYSKNNNFKLFDGVYYKYFRPIDIEDTKKSMLISDMKPYDIKENTPYMYMIRELGGIHTNAYNDGRNEEYSINPYYNSNKTTEPYLLELAYINYPDDLKKALDNPDDFKDAIVSAITKYLEK